MSDQLRQALCCVCGQLRTCRRPRNHRAENYWLAGPVDRDWHRETGELKCSECGRITTHAIITGDNHAETLRKIATGWVNERLTDADYERIRTAWRQGTPQNPRKRHFWWGSDLEKARAAGAVTFQAICKAEILVPKMQSKKGSSSYDVDELVAPKRFHEVDYEDPDTGLWWFEVDCTDCLYLSNEVALGRQRSDLKARLQEIAKSVDHLAASTVAELLASFHNAESSDL